MRYNRRGGNKPSYFDARMGEVMVLESSYQAGLIKRIELRLEGSLVLKQDANLRQGILDLLILWECVWASLEVKAFRGARERPNQGWYVDRLNEMSFAAVIYPENEEEILDELESALRARQAAIRDALFPKSKQTRMGKLRRGQALPGVVYDPSRSPRE